MPRHYFGGPVKVSGELNMLFVSHRNAGCEICFPVIQPVFFYRNNLRTDLRTFPIIHPIYKNNLRFFRKAQVLLCCLYCIFFVCLFV